MNKVVLAPQYASDEVLIEYSKEVVLTRHVLIDVPANYEALFASDEEYVAKISNCSKASLLKKVGKEFKNKTIKIAFFRKTNLPLIPWGFGEVKVNNPKLNVSYTVGCNGNYLLEVANPNKLIKSFATNTVTFTMLKEKTKPYIEPLARPALAKYFVNNELSIYEIESHLEEIRKDIIEALIKEDIFRELGVKLKTVTVNGVYIPENELKEVKRQIEKLGFRNSNSELVKPVEESDIKAIRKEINNIKKELEEKDTDLVLDEIDNLRMEVMEAIKSLKGKEQEKLQQDLLDLNKKIEEITNKE